MDETTTITTKYRRSNMEIDYEEKRKNHKETLVMCLDDLRLKIDEASETIHNDGTPEQCQLYALYQLYAQLYQIMYPQR